MASPRMMLRSWLLTEVEVVRGVCRGSSPPIIPADTNPMSETSVVLEKRVGSQLEMFDPPVTIFDLCVFWFYVLSYSVQWKTICFQFACSFDTLFYVRNFGVSCRSSRLRKRICICRGGVVVFCERTATPNELFLVVCLHANGPVTFFRVKLT